MQKKTVWKQGFYAEVEPILLKDPLSYLLGAQDEEEPFVFNFSDAVMLAGHSCPAVAGAYKLTQKALKALYGDDLPVRGQIRVLIKGAPADLAYGPQAQVISFITGASGETGFKGLGGKHARNNRLFFDRKDVRFNEFVFQREDTGRAVSIAYNPQAVPGDPRMSDVAPLVMRGIASKEQKELFVSLWQGNVKKILLEDELYPGLFTLTELDQGFLFPSNATEGF